MPTRVTRLSLHLLTRLARLLPTLVIASFFKRLTVSNRMPLFKIRMFHVSQACDTIAPDSVVYKPAVLIPAKVISDDASAIEAMQPFPTNVVTPFMPSHPEEPIMEMIVADKYKTGFAQAKIKINAHPDSVKHKHPIHKNRSHRQRRPTDGRVPFRLAPENPGRTPRIIRRPEPAQTGFKTQRP